MARNSINSAIETSVYCPVQKHQVSHISARAQHAREALEDAHLTGLTNGRMVENYQDLVKQTTRLNEAEFSYSQRAKSVYLKAVDYQLLPCIGQKEQ